jgi:hypothetical protein
MDKERGILLKRERLVNRGLVEHKSSRQVDKLGIARRFAEEAVEEGVPFP